MGRQLVEHELMLIKEQTTFGSAESSLDNTNYAEVMEPRLSPAFSSRDMRYAGVNSGQSYSVMGPVEANVGFNIPFKTGGAENSPGLVGTILLAMGFKVTASDTDSDATSDRFVYTLSDVQSDWKDLTIWGYSGNKGSSGSLLRKASNVMLGGRISLNFNDASAILSAEGKGVWGGPATAATQPTCTPSTVLVPALRGATISVFGDSDYRPISLDLDLNQESVVTIDGTATYNKGQSFIRRSGGVKYTLKVYKDLPATHDPETTTITPSTGTISIAWGTAPNKITISFTAQNTSVEDSDENGIQCWTLQGHDVNSSLAIQLDTAAS